MIRIFAAILLATSSAAFAQTACEAPAIPPKLDQARLFCGEAKPTTDEGRAAIAASCPKIWEEYNRLRAPYEKCRENEKVGRLNNFLDDAVKSIPQR